MQLTRAADYAVRVMVHLATLPNKERVLLTALAAATGTPKSFLSKILQALAHAQMISSVRGQKGGFTLLSRGRRASMREVIEAIEGPIYLNVCVKSGKSCARNSWCPAQPYWAKAQEAMLAVLDSTVIAEMAAQASAPSAAAPGAPPLELV